jgi:hypothetical protein
MIRSIVSAGTLNSLLAFLAYTLLMIGGQLCFAIASKHAVHGIVSVFSSVAFWAAVIIYGVASVAWVLLLRTIPLRIAYPSAAAVTSIMLYIWFVLNGRGASLAEPNEFIGIAFILAGLFFIYANR